MPWLGIEPATTRSRVRRANHSATLPLWTHLSLGRVSRNKTCAINVTITKTEIDLSSTDAADVRADVEKTKNPLTITMQFASNARPSDLCLGSDLFHLIKDHVTLIKSKQTNHTLDLSLLLSKLFGLRTVHSLNKPRIKL